MKFLVLTLLLSQSAFAIFSKKLQSKIFKNPPIQSTKAGGAMDGGGSGADFPESGAAWFYEDKSDGQINICIKHDPTFKATLDEAKDSIIFAFKAWENYINKSSIYEVVDGDGNPSTEPYPKNLRILTKINIEDQCTKSTDVIFNFGFINKKVQSVLNNMVNPKAFAYRSYNDIDPIKGTSKGMVYIFNPKFVRGTDATDYNTYNWGHKDKLKAMLLHEVGHIMGVPHLEDTVMEKDFEWLFMMSQSGSIPQQQNQAQRFLTQIDHQNQVLLNSNDLTNLSGSMGMPGSADEKETFKYFTGFDLNGKSKIEFNSEPNIEFFTIIISDNKITKEFKGLKFKQTMANINLNGDHEIFKRVRKVYNNEWQDYSYKTDYELNYSFGINAMLKLGSKNINLDFHFNNGAFSYNDEKNHYWINSPFTMFYYDQIKNKRKFLFVEKINVIPRDN